MGPIIWFDIGGLAVMLTLFAYAAGTAVHQHYSPSPAPVRDSIDD
jgi:hypothetical protein